MNDFLHNLSQKAYRTFLILCGLFFFIFYSLSLITIVDKHIFSDESIAAFKFTLSNLIFSPISLFLAYISVLVIMYIVGAIKNRSFTKPDKKLFFKYVALLAIVVAATFAAMQFHTVLYTDGRIVSNNFIEKLSPEYTAEDYSKVVFYGESVGSSSPKHASRTSFQFYMLFHLDEDNYIEFYPEEFRNNKAILSLSNTLADKFHVLPEDGLPFNVIVNMSESEYELYNMMYAGRTATDDYYEEETEQKHYAFDGYYDFR
ncbi:MAG: hypothetical protein IJW86_10710 [Clostridia bacterium]|nr:hypothetical protein [Clostridia bacterium]MBQ7296641.1 hypothetical protein [Clostridia bacterium]